MQDLELKIENATRNDWLNFQKALGQDKVRTLGKNNTTEDPFSSFGEPATATLVLTVVSSAITGVSIWLAKQRKLRRDKLKFYMTKPDGTQIHLELSSFSLDEKEASKEITEELHKMIEVNSESSDGNKLN